MLQGNTLLGISCPAPATCYAVGGSGTEVVTFDAGTSWTIPSPGIGETLNAVDCPSLSLCYATGANGGIWVSTNPAGGAYHFSRLFQSSSFAAQTGISCPTPSICYAVGSGSSIVMTTDSGATWSPENSGVFVDFKGINCPSTAVCYAVGFYYVGLSVGGAILGTTNSGATWSVLDSGIQATTSISCPTPTTCYVGANSIVYVTTNSGGAWTPHQLSGAPYLTGIFCPTSTSCYASGSHATIVATTDSGSTWTQQVSGAKVDLEGVTCLSASSCFVVGDGGVTLSTTDSGGHWTSVGSSAPTYDALTGISCPTTAICYAVGPDCQLRYCYGFGSGQAILATYDFGTSWSRQAAPFTDYSLNDVSCPTANTCYAVGYQLNDPLCPEAANVVVKTTDSGAHWVSLVKSQCANYGDYYDGISCPSVSTCYLVAAIYSGSYILATTDGGATWVTKYPGFFGTHQFRRIVCPDVAHCYAVGAVFNGGSGYGNYGSIISTADSGTTWTVLTTPAINNCNYSGDVTDPCFTGLSCPAISTCYVVGYETLCAACSAVQGLLLATTDSGATWNVQTLSAGGTTPVTPIATAISCSSTTTCSATVWTNNGGGSSWIASTTDSWGTWTWEEAGTSDRLVAASCTSSNVCYVVGESGAILASSTVPDPPEQVTAVAGNSSAQISWSAPASNGLAITSYTITPYIGTTAQSPTTVGGNVISATVAGLMNGTAYTFTVSASNLAGTGPASSPSGAVTPVGPPIPPTSVKAVAGDTEATVTWIPPTVGAPMTGYTVVASPGGATTTVTAVVPAATITGLTNGTAYTFTVAATNAIGTGPASAASSVVTPAAVSQGPSVAMLPAMSNLAYGGYLTTAYLENVGAGAAHVRVQYFDTTGHSVGFGNSAAGLPQGATWTLRTDNGHSLAATQAGSAVVYSDQPLAVFVNEFAPGNTSDATSYSSISAPSGTGGTLYAPAIANNAYGGYTTGIGLVNLATTSANITITYRDGTGAQIKAQTVPDVAAGAYQGLYSGDAILNLPNGFAGTATITSSAGNLAAVVNETGPGGQFSSYDAVPAGSTTLFAPAALSNAYGGYNTGMGIQNTTGSAGTVTINYYDANGVATTKSFPIVANGYLGIYQGTDITFAGAYTAKITSTVAIAGIVNEVAAVTNPLVQQSTAYDMFAAGSSSLHLPLVESGGSDGWSTGEGIMNTGTAATTVTVTYYEAASGLQVGTPDSLLLQPNAFWGLYQPAGGLPSGTRATAVITTSSGGQVAVICNESSSTTFMSYDGQ